MSLRHGAKGSLDELRCSCKPYAKGSIWMQSKSLLLRNATSDASLLLRGVALVPCRHPCCHAIHAHSMLACRHSAGRWSPCDRKLKRQRLFDIHVETRECCMQLTPPCLFLVRDWLRVIASNKDRNVYELRYFNIADNEGEDEE
eukprot:75001-Pelagomonas_calceolata.AAC.2